ncbi:MAG: response regulator [Alphaproteobacteria bacterium]|nr:response regulator [Alphaproteobacteria bacterium]
MSKRIMVVEDSPTQAIRLQYALEQEGFDSICVNSAEQALEALNLMLPDLMIVDYHLPGASGVELCRRIRLNVATQSLPIIMLTSDATADSQVAGLDSGADDYVAKSDDFNMLILRVHGVLRRSAQPEMLLRPAEPMFHQAHLLVIDDSPTYLEYLRATLADEGYTIDAAEDGPKGIELAKQNSYECVLVDLIMPAMDGTTVCQELVKLNRPEDPPIVILMMSAFESRDNAIRALESGADDFVGKSTDMAILKGRIRALLRNRFLRKQTQRLIEDARMREAKLELMVEERTQSLQREIEERKRIEEDLLQAKENAEASNVAKSRFLSNMSHELRTPLNAIIGFADVMRHKMFGPFDCDKYREYLDDIHHAAHHLLRIINDILDISRVESGRLDLYEEEFELADAIHSVARLVGDQVRRQELTLDILLDDGLPHVRADRRILEQAFLNLLYNAAKFTPSGGVIAVRAVREADGGLAIAFSDTGIGIAAEDLERVMTPFGQVENRMQRQHAGTGLGLPLSETFIKLHGGRLDIQSEVNKGTTVTLHLPPERVVAS